MSNLYNKIKVLATEKGETIASISKKAGISSSTLYEVKSGKRKHDISRTTAVKLADALGVSVDELCVDKKNIPDTEMSEKRAEIIRMYLQLSEENREIACFLLEALIARQDKE